ncbi:uncharacterized protein [Halyomorpha halys]|uniref:uncharacterized protein n=1 Tax=Halyomorpha halys TaxID=286706 RepID=UPI0006D50F83|nr:uncharacterized protein LOC106686492 [Halyomorpha halys]
MECVTTETSELKSKSENPDKEDTVPNQINVTDPIYMVVLEKRKEVEENKSKRSKKSERDLRGLNREMTNVLGVLGKFLYNQRKKQNKMQKIPIEKKIKKHRHNMPKRYRKVDSNKVSNISARNWRRLSIYPFINFIRDYRKRVPKECPPETMALEARRIWRQMKSIEKLPFFKRAGRALQNGYKE